jgi:hypothetical protein
MTIPEWRQIFQRLAELQLRAGAPEPVYSTAGTALGTTSRSLYQLLQEEADTGAPPTARPCPHCGQPGDFLLVSGLSTNTASYRCSNSHTWLAPPPTP